jgi:redox-sensitive bicupin YhaK (pirin superfamily)
VELVMKKVLGIYSPSSPHWVGDGFPVKTLFSYDVFGEQISPFLLLDHAGPMNFSASTKKRGVGVHPHRGFETVTLVYQGGVAHRDSSGKGGVIGPGDVQWMTAGSGILHEEYHSDEFAQSGGLMEMVQLWVNLPKTHKMTEPKYQAITAEQIPQISILEGKGKIRLIAGELFDMKGPTETHTPMMVLDMSLTSGSQYLLPLAQSWSGIVMMRKGQASINGQLVTEGQTMILSHDGQGIEIESPDSSELVILSGEPLAEPIFGYGPFVMNSQAEIDVAIKDFQQGKFGHI